MKNNKAKLTEGSEVKTIVKMAFGMLFGFGAMTAFNAVDTYFVGQLGATELAAMSFTFPVVMVVASVTMGLGVGISSVVSRAIGAEDSDKVVRLTSDGLAFSVFLVLIISIIGLLTINPLFLVLGAEGETLGYIKDYMTIWYIGVPFLVIPMAGNSVIRATGDTLTPSMIMIVSVIVNTVLDPLLIFGIGPFPEMGIKGAAIATVAARIASLMFSLSILVFREKLLSFRLPKMKDAVSSWKQILYVGVPAAGVQIINPISLGIITRLLSGYGENAVAGFGTAGRIEMIIMIIPMALAAVMGPFAGQNWGAHQVGRIIKAVRFSGAVSALWGALIFILSFFFAEPVLALFNPHPEIIQTGAAYLKIASLGYGFLGIMAISSLCLNALNKPLHSALITLIKAFAVNIPLAFLGAHFWQQTGIFAASLLANIAGGLLGFVLLFTLLKKCYNKIK